MTDLDGTVFHVEHGSRVQAFFKYRRDLGGGNENLRGGCGQQLQYALLVVPVQFRPQVVQGDHRPFAPLGRVIVETFRRIPEKPPANLAAFFMPPSAGALITL